MAAVAKKRKVGSKREAALIFTTARKSNEKAIKASYKVAKEIVMHGKSFGDGEFIKRCLMKMAEICFPEKKQEFANLCLDRDTVAQRIEDLSSDIKRQLEARAMEFDFFSLACYEIMDAFVLIFLRGVDNNMKVTNELLDIQRLEDQTSGTDLFVSVCSAVDGMKLPWNKFTGITTDGTPAMVGLSTLICDKVSKEGGKAIKLHCISHHQVLCAKHLKYDHVMKLVLKAIHYIGSEGLYHEEFDQFISDIHAEYGDVVYHDEVTWLSQGSALQRFYSLREEIRLFLAEKAQPMPELSDPVWLADLGFLVDITQHLNTLNTSLQRRFAVVSQLYSHIKDFGTKLLLFQRHMSQTQPDTTYFPSLQEVMTSFPQHNMCAQIKRYEADISSLAEEFQQRVQDFAAIEKDITLFSSPLTVDPEDAPDHLQMDLIDLQCDFICCSQYRSLPLVNFYRQLDQDGFQEFRKFAKKMISLFGSTYLCEKTFSIMNKNSIEMALSDHLRDILRIQTTAFQPDVDYIVQSRFQCHPSH